MLDNEPFNVGVPKTDSKTDYKWNDKGDRNVLAVITTNVEIMYIRDNAVDPVETKVWNDRFGLILHFRKALPKTDKRYKTWFQCTRCYAEWILGSDGCEPQTPNAKQPRTGAGPGSAEQAQNGQMSAITLPVIPPLPISSFDDPDDDPFFDCGWGPDDCAVEPRPSVAPPAATPGSIGEEQEQRSSAGDAGAQPSVAIPTVTPAIVTVEPEQSLSACDAIPLPDPTTPEPLRALNLYLERCGSKAHFVEREERGVGWNVQVTAVGLCSSASASSKKSAKREAARAFLQNLPSK